MKAFTNTYQEHPLEWRAWFAVAPISYMRLTIPSKLGCTRNGSRQTCWLLHAAYTPDLDSPRQLSLLFCSFFVAFVRGILNLKAVNDPDLLSLPPLSEQAVILSVGFDGSAVPFLPGSRLRPLPCITESKGEMFEIDKWRLMSSPRRRRMKAKGIFMRHTVTSML